MVVTHCDGTCRLNERRERWAGIRWIRHLQVEEPTPYEVVNRVLAIGVMWLSVLVILLRKGFEQELFEKWRSLRMPQPFTKVET